MGLLKSILLSRKLLWLPPVLVGIAVFSFFVNRKRELPRTEVKEVALPIEVLRVAARDIVPAVTGFGSAQPSRRWTAVAEVSGRVVEINPQLKTGNAVQVGELLFKIDPSDYELQLSQRQSDLAVSRAALDETLASQSADKQSLDIEVNLSAVSQRELDRQLLLQNQRIVSESELETAKTNVLMQQQAVQRLRNTLSLYPSKINSRQAQVNLAKSRVDESRRNLQRTEVRSPFAGTLAGVTVEVGQVVAPNQTLFELHDTSSVEVEAHFSLAQLQRVLPSEADRYALGDRLQNWLPELEAVVVASSGNTMQRYLGRPLRVTESVDAQTRTLGVVIAVVNSGEGPLNQSLHADGKLSQEVLRPGAFCEIELRSQTATRGIAIPRASLDDGAVYVVDGDSRLHRRVIKTSSVIGDLAIVASGLDVGQRIAVQPPVPAIEGMLVEPVAAK